MRSFEHAALRVTSHTAVSTYIKCFLNCFCGRGYALPLRLHDTHPPPVSAFPHLPPLSLQGPCPSVSGSSPFATVSMEESGFLHGMKAGQNYGSQEGVRWPSPFIHKYPLPHFHKGGVSQVTDGWRQEVGKKGQEQSSLAS